MQDKIRKILLTFIKIFRFFIKLETLDIFFSKFLSTKFKKNRLEITSTIGCAMMCDYCPQTLIKSTLDKNIDNRILNKESFLKYFDNISNNTIIHWSGYSEPLAHKDFEFFVNYLSENKYEQHISTTMFGRNSTEEYMSKTKVFKSITFHLPDDSNLMKLKVTERYLKNLKGALINHSKYLNKKNIYIVVFGKGFNPQVKSLINNLINTGILSNDSIDIRDHLHSRNGEILNEDFRTNISGGIDNDKKNKLLKSKLYYCSYGRLDQGVLLPNGDINLCCQDYSLKGIIGNLRKKNLNELYNQDIIFEKNFHKGEYNLCKKCEYYKNI